MTLKNFPFLSPSNSKILAALQWLHWRVIFSFTSKLTHLKTEPHIFNCIKCPSNYKKINKIYLIEETFRKFLEALCANETIFVINFSV